MIWLALWLLSQTLGFALPALSSFADQGTPPSSPWEQCQAGITKVTYDACSLSRLVYDAEFPSATPQGLSDTVGTVPTIPAYDPCSVSTMRVTGAPRARPVAEVGIVAAKTAPELLLDSNVVIGKGKEFVASGQNVVKASISDVEIANLVN